MDKILLLKTYSSFFSVLKEAKYNLFKYSKSKRKNRLVGRKTTFLYRKKFTKFSKTFATFLHAKLW